VAVVTAMTEYNDTDSGADYGNGTNESTIFTRYVTLTIMPIMTIVLEKEEVSL
jgi:hypothetical protein